MLLRGLLTPAARVIDEDLNPVQLPGDGRLIHPAVHDLIIADGNGLVSKCRLRIQ